MRAVRYEYGVRRKGWGKPANSRKAHYFVDGNSLCGAWTFKGDVRTRGPQLQWPACVTCRNRVGGRPANRTQMR